jgi:hypothetical protein
MTEQEWMGCIEPTPMLEFLRGKASERKLRLVACACVRDVWHLLPEEASRQAVELSEQYADSEADAIQLDGARSVASRAYTRVVDLLTGSAADSGPETGKRARQLKWGGRPNAARAAALVADRDISSVVMALGYPPGDATPLSGSLSS